jgi:signal transduction histidine kinase/CHASE2 domain-containing sensor protein
LLYIFLPAFENMMKADPHNVRSESLRLRLVVKVLSLVAIALTAATLGVLLTWRAPGLALYAEDGLMRARGQLPPPDNIVIVAIDEASIARFGRFPWSRQLMADALIKLAPAQTKAIALDVLYSDQTFAADDQRLASAIRQAGNVVVAAQLIDAGEIDAVWLRPLGEIEAAAAGTGHVNVSTESGGVVRRLLMREADDEGKAYWAMAVETIRVGDGLDQASVREVPGMVRIGNRSIPTEQQTENLVITSRDSASPDILHASNLTIDYLGATGSFAAQTVSFVDLIDGRIAPERLRDKYVLIGATAAGLGDRLATPFVSREDASSKQHGSFVPGVELLAHSMDTILRERYYSPTSDWLAFLCAALIAVSIISLFSLVQGQYETLKQLTALTFLGAAIIGGSYLLFTRWLIIPPLLPMLTAFAVATPLTLLRRLLYTNAALDSRIAELTEPPAGFSPLLDEHAEMANPAKFIAKLCEASAVAIFATKPARRGSSTEYQQVAEYGGVTFPVPNKQSLQNLAQNSLLHATVNGSASGEARGDLYFACEMPHTVPVTSAFHLGDFNEPSGALMIAHPMEREIPSDLARLCKEVASSYVQILASRKLTSARRAWRPIWLKWPRGIEWKSHRLGELSRRIFAQTRFIDRSLQAVEDGLIIAGVDTKIHFVNAHAAQVFGLSENSLIGSDLFERLEELEMGSNAVSDENTRRKTQEALFRLLVERQPVERELVTLGNPIRHFILRLSTVSAPEAASSSPLGIVGALSDITKQRELQQMKNDVMAFVSHELKTPLTAIQGMSEVLAQYEVESARRREMHLAINDEAKRLARMIEDYLDITRLESGARPLRIGSVRISQVIERIVLLLEPLAARRDIRLNCRLSPNLPVIIGDPDLLARALTNLVSNAIKYSPANTEVFIEAQADNEFLQIKVIDQGYGIPADSLSRIFEKFYRVPCVEDVDATGIGLGLAFVREIAELHGGRVTVQSDWGRGSTFSLSLPLYAKRLVC